MLKRSLVSRWFTSLIGILVAVMVVTAGALLVSAHQGDSGTYNSDWIHACRHNNTGQLQYVGPNGTCGNNETSIHWPASQPPFTTTIVEGEVVSTDPQSFEGHVGGGVLITSTATCPAGKALLGGGAKIASSGGEHAVAIRASYPSGANVWTATAAAIGQFGFFGSVTVQAVALCSP
jgi:hypothetical protein